MRILPQHEQHYPDHLLAQRLEEYVFDDGRPPTRIRAQGAKVVTGQQVLDVVRSAQAKLDLTSIDPRYFVATCFHEAGCTNEWDTEVASLSCHEGFVSVGAYQIGNEEAQRYAFALADMLDLEKATVCMVHLAERNRLFIRRTLLLRDDQRDPDYTDAKGTVWKGGGMRAYLAIAHNKGCGFAQKTILTHGLDWSRYKQRNPTDNLVAHGYGDDVITGGAHWPAGA